MEDINSPGPSGLKKPKLSRKFQSRFLTEKQLQEEINIIETESCPESSLSSESDIDFSDDNSVIDKNYATESSCSSEDSEFQSGDEQQFDPEVEQQDDLDDEQQIGPDEEQQLQYEQITNANLRHRKPNKYISDEHYGWDEEEREAEEWDFTGITSVNINLPADAKPIDYLDQFFDNEIIQTIVCETNRRGSEQSPDRSQQSRRRRNCIWKEVSIQEMRKFLGLCVLGGIVKVPSLAKQWSRQSIYYHPVFGKTMSRDRFLGILKMLRFVNHTGINTDDRLHKIRNILDAILRNIKRCYSPGRELSIDEAMILWRGRLIFRQYIANKRHKYGMKLYELTTHDGYILNLIVYTGKGSLSTQDVKHLMKDYLDKGHILFMDNFYNSVALAEFLFEKKTHVVGTLRDDRVGNPKDLLKKKLKQGEAVWKRKGPVLVTKWKDKRDVRMISTKHKHDMIEFVGKRGARKIKPACVLDYNKHMSGIDRADQMLSYYSTPRKTIRWYRKLFFHLFDICIWNSFYIYKKVTKKNVSFLQFRESIVEDLIQTNMVPGVHSGSISSHHYPEQIPISEKNKSGMLRCRYCTKLNTRKRSRYYCPTCPDSPGLCISPCYKMWHTNRQ